MATILVLTLLPKAVVSSSYSQTTRNSSEAKKMTGKKSQTVKEGKRVGFKPSRYNKFVQLGSGSVLAYNALSGALARLTQDQYQNVREFLDHPTGVLGPLNEQNSYVSFLLEGRFVVDDDVDEVDILKTRNLVGRFTQDKLGVTIMPTLNCNFRCIYCFEEHRNKTMSQEVQDSLAEWVQFQMSHRRRLEVGWFGGEPLLRLDIIKSLSERLQEICHARGCEYKAEMSTNGYLLTADVCRSLKQMGVTQVQVALDGPARIHDQRRRLAGGGPTFDVIMRNLVDAVQEGDIKLVLRPTVDKGNAAAVFELMDILIRAGIHDKLLFNPQNVQPSPVNDLSCLGGCVPNTAEFADTRADILIYASRKGFKIDAPYLLCQACPSHNINSFQVSPDGDLFKCGSFLRPEDRVGFLDPSHPEKARIDFAKLWKWVGRDPFEDKQCRECDVLPLCMGGCRALQNETAERDSHCIYYRYNLAKELAGRYGEAA